MEFHAQSPRQDQDPRHGIPRVRRRFLDDPKVIPDFLKSFNCLPAVTEWNIAETNWCGDELVESAEGLGLGSDGR